MSRVDALGNIALADGDLSGGGALKAGGSVSLNGASALVGTITAGARLEATLSGNLTASAVTAGNSINLSAGGKVTLANVTTGDDLTINADSASLQALNATFSGGVDDRGDGSNIRITTVGDLALTTANAVFGIELTTTGAGNIAANTLFNNNAGATLKATGSGSITVNRFDIAGDIRVETRSGRVDATDIVSRVGSLYINSGGAVSAGTDTAGRIEIRGTSITGNNLTARNSMRLSTGGAVVANNLITGDDLTINADKVDLKALTGNLHRRHRRQRRRIEHPHRHERPAPADHRQCGAWHRADHL